MTIPREKLIAAIRGGIVTRSALMVHFEDEALPKALSNLVDTGLATRYLDTDGAAYKLTEKGRAWKPEQRGAALRAAMRRTAA